MNIIPLAIENYDMPRLITTKRQRATALLMRLLHQENLPAEQVFAEARKLEICESIVRMAKKDLGVKTKHIGGAGGYWTWSLPKP